MNLGLDIEVVAHLDVVHHRFHHFVHVVVRRYQARALQALNTLFSACCCHSRSASIGPGSDEPVAVSCTPALSTFIS